MSGLHADAFVEEKVVPSKELVVLSDVAGWLYFVCWTLSFYPQTVSNFRRKSVIGVSFDFYAINFVGFVTYCIFNCFLYWDEKVKQEYFTRYEGGQNAVLLNDVFFSIHAMLISAIALTQCIVYENGGQKLSLVTKGILGTSVAIIAVSGILAFVHTIEWLTFLYICSYIKLFTTLIKYMPQALLNFRRKSTSGWRIEPFILDFSGGILSMAQMIINSYNYGDWVATLGNPAKFGLGFVCVCFDVVFLIQHYILYRKPSSKSPGKTVQR